MNRRYIAAAAALAVSALAGTSANAQTVVVPVGTADTIVDLAAVNVSGAPVGGIDIGSVRSFASTDTNQTYNPVGKGKPFAIAKVTLPDGSSQSVRSDGDTGNEGTTVPIAGVGSVTVGNLTAQAGQDSAASVVNAIDGELRAVVAGLKARAAGVNAVVEADRASTTNGAVIEKISVGLDDVLPMDVLSKLPLGKVLGLVDGLGLDIDLGALNGVADQVRALSAGLDDVQEADAAVETAQEAVAEANVTARKAEKTLSDAQKARKDAEDTLNGLLGAQSHLVDEIIDDVNDTVGGVEDDVNDTVDDIDDTVDDVTGGGDGDNDDDGTPDAVERGRERLDNAVKKVADAERALNTANAALAAAKADLDEAIDTLQSLLAMVADLADKVAELDLEGLLGALLEGVSGLELIGIDRMSVGVTTMADATTSKASTLCQLSGVRILGEVKSVPDCAALHTVVEDVEAKLDQVIALLPVQGIVPTDVVTVSGPRISASPEGYAAEGYRIASAKISGLDLNVKSVSLSQVADGMVHEVRAIIDDTLAKVEGLAGVSLPVADVEAKLNELLAELDKLPVGDLLRGLSTPAVDLSAIDVASRSTFRAAGSGVDGVGVGGPAGDLPHTGGGVGMALLLLAAGGAVWAVIRPRTSRVGA